MCCCSYGEGVERTVVAVDGHAVAPRQVRKDGRGGHLDDLSEDGDDGDEVVEGDGAAGALFKDVEDVFEGGRPLLLSPSGLSSGRCSAA